MGKRKSLNGAVIETKDGDPIRLLNVDTTLVDPASLTPHEANPRQGDVGELVTSFEKTGFYGSVIVEEGTNRVLAGNHRVIAALAIGMQKIPVQYVSVDDDLHALAILVGDNRTSDIASYDTALLVEVLQTLATSERTLAGTGYNGDDLDDVISLLQYTDLVSTKDGKGVDPDEHWNDMPGFEHEDKTAFRSIIVHLSDQEAVDNFSRLIKQKIGDRTKYVWYPELEVISSKNKRYVSAA